MTRVLAAADSTLPQLGADALLVVLVIINAYLGWRRGTVRRLIAFAGLYVGFLGAYYVGNSFAGIFRKNDLYANAWAFVSIMAAVVILSELLGVLLADRLSRIAVIAFDRFTGVLAGALLGFFEALSVFLVALAVGAAGPAAGASVPPGHDAAANAVRAATLSGQAVRAEPAIRAAFEPLLGNDLPAHLASG